MKIENGWGVAEADFQTKQGILAQEEVPLHFIKDSRACADFDQVMAGICEGFSPASFSWETRPGRETTVAPER